MELKAIVLLNITLNPFLNPFYVCIDDSLLAGLVLQIFKVRFVVNIVQKVLIVKLKNYVLAS